jgi:uncharacterized membrane protein
MQGVKRRVVYVTAYEGIAILITAAAMVLLGYDAGHAGAASVMASAVAILWNLAWNWLFEAWEARQAAGGRGVARRIAHAIGFEGGLLVFLVPLMAWWLGIGLFEALVLDVGFLAFFLVYTFVFNLGFDTLFGLPASALRAEREPAPGDPRMTRCPGATSS